jgi:uncharacterized protein (UPF0261 family)
MNGNGNGNGRRERFELELERDVEGRVDGVQITTTDLAERQRISHLNGFRLPRAVGPIHDLLRERGISSRDWSNSASIELDQATGAQVELLIRSVKPLRRLDRLDRVIDGIVSMSREEATYWHVQMNNRAGLRALRLLLGERRLK